jgi:hypothetical protein
VAGSLPDEPARGAGTAEQTPPLAGRCYREIRSARFPQGLPDRSDETVLEEFEGGWLLIDHSPGGVEVVGLADDYDEARAWLDQGGAMDHPADPDPDPGHA